MIDMRRTLNLKDHCAEFNTSDYFHPQRKFENGELGNMKVLLYSKYTQVTGLSNGRKLLRLKFLPIGSIIRANIKNPLAESIYVDKVRLSNTNVIAGNVKLCFGEEDQNGNLKFEPKSRKERNCDIPYDYNKEITSGSTISTYLWCIPTDNRQYISSQYEIVYRTSRSNAKDSIVVKQAHPKTLSSGFENSKTYAMNCSLPQSDLMITEMLHSNKRGYNSSVIEIYNPTDHAIDLSDYALARIRDWDPNKGGKDAGYVAEWQGYTKDHKPFKYALMQSLYIEPSKQDKPGTIYRGDGNRVNDDNGWTINNGNGADDPSKWYTNSYNGALNRYRLMYVNHKSGRYDKMLMPGKCIVLCAGAVYADYVKQWRPDYETFPEGSRAYNMPYLANAVFENYCQYVIAVDNGSSANAYQHNAYGGTFQHGTRHIMVLCKRNGQGSPYKPIDFMMGTHTIERFGRIKQSFDFGGSLSGGDDFQWYGRKEGVMYPTYIKENSDYYDRSKDKLPKSAADIQLNTVYEYYDWYTIVGSPSLPANQSYKKYSPGTRIFYDETYNNNYKISGAPTIYD